LALDRAPITAGPFAARVGGDLHVWWESSAPAGSTHQLYVDGRLAYFGPDRRAVVPPPPGRPFLVVGVVPAADAQEHHGADLPPPPGGGEFARLTWEGGTYLDPRLVGFRMYQGATPGAAVDYARPVAAIPAYPAGIICDGYGVGGYGKGGYGAAAGSYAWTSGRLAPGTWHFGVRPYNTAGVEGAAYEWSVAIGGPPAPPARFADGSRLHSAYDPTTRTVTITWNPPAY
jgi:hypothetical protein